MTGPTTERLAADKDGIGCAAEILRRGGLVAFPTETVYGLGANATDATAAARIFEAKARPSFNPLIVHIADRFRAETLGDFSPEAKALAAAFWPGPLTLVVPLRPEAQIPPLVTAGLDSIALRVPAHPVAQALLAEADLPLAAPSANPSGSVSPTTADHVLDGLAGRIDAVLDGGPCEVGVESTIVSCLDQPRLLRPGGIPVEAIEDCLGTTLAPPPQSETPTAPGMLASHYAPRATLRLNATEAEPGEILLGFGPVGQDRSLSVSGDLREAAARLFAELRALDREGVERIAVAPIPNTGLGRAINDRLARAAAPRTQA